MCRLKLTGNGCTVCWGKGSLERTLSRNLWTAVLWTVVNWKVEQVWDLFWAYWLSHSCFAQKPWRLERCDTRKHGFASSGVAALGFPTSLEGVEEVGTLTHPMNPWGMPTMRYEGPMACGWTSILAYKWRKGVLKVRASWFHQSLGFNRHRLAGDTSICCQQETGLTANNLLTLDTAMRILWTVGRRNVACAAADTSETRRFPDPVASGFRTGQIKCT